MLTTSLAYPKDYVFVSRPICVLHIIKYHSLEFSISNPNPRFTEKKNKSNKKKKKKLNKKVSVQTLHV